MPDLQEIPIFPLPDVVLYPDTLAPLHIFEARYREMTATALKGEGVIGLVAVRPEHLDEMAGDPPVYEVGCAGRIVEHERHADGRYHLLLKACGRFRIHRELPRGAGRLHRRARVEMLGEPQGDTEAGEATRRRVLALLQRMMGKEGLSAGALTSLARCRLENFAHKLAQQLRAPVEEKQAWLEAQDVAARAALIEAGLEFERAARQGAAAEGTQTRH